MEWLHQSEFIKGFEKQCSAQLCKFLCGLHPLDVMSFNDVNQAQHFFVFGVGDRFVRAILAEFAVSLSRGDRQQRVDRLKQCLLSFGHKLCRRKFEAAFQHHRLEGTHKAIRL